SARSPFAGSAGARTRTARSTHHFRASHYHSGVPVFSACAVSSVAGDNPSTDSRGSGIFGAVAGCLIPGIWSASPGLYALPVCYCAVILLFIFRPEMPPPALFFLNHWFFLKKGLVPQSEKPSGTHGGIPDWRGNGCCRFPHLHCGRRGPFDWLHRLGQSGTAKNGDRRSSHPSGWNHCNQSFVATQSIVHCALRAVFKYLLFRDLLA